MVEDPEVRTLQEKIQALNAKLKQEREMLESAVGAERYCLEVCIQALEQREHELQAQLEASKAWSAASVRTITDGTVVIPSVGPVMICKSFC